MPNFLPGEPTPGGTPTGPGGKMPQRRFPPTPGPKPPTPRRAGGGATTTSGTSAQMPGESRRLSRSYEDYIKSLQGNSGVAMETAMAKIRDAREGGRASLMEGAAARGIASTPDLQKYEEGTQGEMARAATDIGLGREAMIGEAMRGAPGVYESPYRLAQGEKQIGLSAQGLNLQREQAEQAAAAAARQAEFDNFMALLSAQRSSPAPGAGTWSIGEGAQSAASMAPVPTRRRGSGFGGGGFGRM